MSKNHHIKLNKEHNSFIKEGLAIVTNPDDSKIFYNEAQIYNRDLSIIVLRAFAEYQIIQINKKYEEAKKKAETQNSNPPSPLVFGGFNILEPLAATGLRSIRYSKELGSRVKFCLANDFDPVAVLNIQKNCLLNNIPPNKIIGTCMDAKYLMHQMSPYNVCFDNFLNRLNCIPAGAKIPFECIYASFKSKNKFPTSSSTLVTINDIIQTTNKFHHCGKKGDRKDSLNTKSLLNNKDEFVPEPMNEIIHFKGLPFLCTNIRSSLQNNLDTAMRNENDDAPESSCDLTNRENDQVFENKKDAEKIHTIEFSNNENSNLFVSSRNKDLIQSTDSILSAQERSILNELPWELSATSFSYSNRSRSDQNIDSKINNQVNCDENCFQDAKPILNSLSFDVIDIDPYGSVCEYIDAAVHMVRSGGILCLTSTDMTVLCGKNPEVSFYKYGGNALKAKYHHEMSLRILLNAVITSASKYKRVAIPLLSCSIDFYIRIFVQIKDSPEFCKLTFKNTSLVLQCGGCDSFYTVPLGNSSKKGEIRDKKTTIPKTICEGLEIDEEIEAACHDTDYILPIKPSEMKFSPGQLPHDLNSKCIECNSKIFIGGPMFSGPLHNTQFVDLCLAECEKISEEESSGVTTLTKIRGLLIAIREELVDVPLYYNLSSLCNRVKINMIKHTKMKSALLNSGYNVSHFHRDPQSIKTNAPNYVVFDIIREHAKLHPPKNLESCHILCRPISMNDKVDFTYNKDCERKAAAQKNGIDSGKLPIERISRWLPNPKPYWGPKSRAKRTKCFSNEIKVNEEYPSNVFSA